MLEHLQVRLIILSDLDSQLPLCVLLEKPGGQLKIIKY